MLFFTSDTHFGHARIVELCDRPYTDSGHMDEMIIYNWNKVVEPRDTVIHLGDVALGAFEFSIQKVKRLNGYKVLVPGNHDRIFSGEKQARIERFTPVYKDVFNQVVEESKPLNLINEEGIQVPVIISHFPYTGDSHDGDRFESQRPVDNGLPLLHGHTHSRSKVSRSKKGTLQIHVGIDAWNYRPVSELEILKLIKDNS